MGNDEIKGKPAEWQGMGCLDPKFGFFTVVRSRRKGDEEIKGKAFLALDDRFEYELVVSLKTRAGVSSTRARRGLVDSARLLAKRVGVHAKALAYDLLEVLEGNNGR